eukprot:jgi/Picsp_1/3642/NSC_06479-R1_chitinase chi60
MRIYSLFLLLLFGGVGLGLKDTCAVGDATCLCETFSVPASTGVGKMLPSLADVTSKCRSFYSCGNGSGEGSYGICSDGHIFSESEQRCTVGDSSECKSIMHSEETVLEGKDVSIPEMLEEQPATDFGYRYVGYFQSWSERYYTDPALTPLANLPSYVNYVNLAFMAPNTSYAGGTTLEGTGLAFWSEGSVVKESIRILKERNPGTKVLVSVGGALLKNFEELNAEGVALFVQEFGLDGVDLDFEVLNADCQQDDQGFISCHTDELYIATVKALRSALPDDKILTAAVWSIGAFGEGEFVDAQPIGSLTGSSIVMLKTAGTLLESINVMAYDAGSIYSPELAYMAYSKLFDGPVTLGIEISNHSWGGHVLTMQEVDRLSNFVKDRGGAGMMLWSLQKPADQGPDAQTVSQEVCRVFDQPNCSDPLFPLASPPPPPEVEPSPLPPPPPPEESCVYDSIVRIRTTRCPSNRYLTYSTSECDNHDVTLKKAIHAYKNWNATYWSLRKRGYPENVTPIEALHRRKKCDRYLLTLADNQPSVPLSSSLSWIWSIKPVSNTGCSRVKLYSIKTFRYLATNSDCTGFESSMYGDVFQVFDPKK